MEGKAIISGRREPPTGAEGTVVSWSRRRLLTDAVLPLAFALSLAHAFGQERTESPPRLQRLPATGAAPSPAGGSGAVPSTTDLSGRFTTAVRIDGQGPFRFMVDTGAERTVIAADLVQRLGLSSGRQVLVQGIVRREPASLAEIRELRMGSLVSSRLEAPTLPRNMLGADGYLGLDVLDGRRVVFDFTAGTLTVTKPQGFFSALFSRDDDVHVHTLGSSGRLRATDCLIDGVHAAAFIDTGAEMSIINEALHAALQRRDPTRTTLATELLTGVTGGTVEGATTMLNMVCVGDLILTFALAVVADLPVFATWGLTRQPALLIGMDVLRRCERVSIDYRRKELLFKLAGGLTPAPLQAASKWPALSG